jgi:hypothetical protein
LFHHTHKGRPVGASKIKFCRVKLALGGLRN